MSASAEARPLPAQGAHGLVSPESAALVFVGGEASPSLRDEARRAGILQVDVHATLTVQAMDQVAAPGVVRISHVGPSPFYASDIDLILRSNGIRTLYLCGESQAAARLAYDAQRRGFQPVLVSSSVGVAEIFGLPLPQIEATEFSRLLALTPEGPRNWHAEVKAARMARPFPERVEPRHSALILIDVLNDFCTDAGLIARTKTEIPHVLAAIPRIRALLEGARAADVSIFHVQAIYGPMFRGQGSPFRYPSHATAEGAVWCASAADLDDQAAQFDPDVVEVCLEATHGADFLPEVSPQGHETVIRKHRYSALLDTALDGELRRRGIQTVVLAGVTTNCCVESTARDLAMSDYDTIVAEDCVATKDLVRHLHYASLEQIRTYFGIVTPSQRILDQWR